MSKPILNELELGTLKGMAIYWREVFKRDDPVTRQHIMNAELSSVTELLESEKVLRIINEYVKDLSDKGPKCIFTTQKEIDSARRRQNT